MPEHIDAAVELIHRVVGYPLAFVVAPLALASFAGAPRHRGAGIAYVVLMTFLYVTGTSLTLTRHAWGTWEFGRNVVFNLFGYSMLLYGFRSMWLLNHAARPRPARLDRALLALLIATVTVMALLAIPKNTPLRVFSIIGFTLVVLELRDWRAGLPAVALYARHVRYMLGSYFYVLTVVSLVHLTDEVGRNVRWLWPAALGVTVIWLASGGPTPRGWRGLARRRAVHATIAVALAFGAYAAWDLMRAGAPRTCRPAARPPRPCRRSWGRRSRPACTAARASCS